MPTFFLNPGAISAHTHLDSLGGDTEFLGFDEQVIRGYSIQEIRIEGNEFVLLYDGEEFRRYEMDTERLIDEVQIGNNDGGSGVIDFVSITFAE